MFQSYLIILKPYEGTVNVLVILNVNLKQIKWKEGIIYDDMVMPK